MEEDEKMAVARLMGLTMNTRQPPALKTFFPFKQDEQSSSIHKASSLIATTDTDLGMRVS